MLQSRQILAITYDLSYSHAFKHYYEFQNYCHYVSHNQATIGYMKTSLKAFKDAVLEEFGDYDDFWYLKFHILEHYPEQIERFGSLLNGDTETPEGLHPTIKRAFKNTNKKGKLP